MHTYTPTKGETKPNTIPPAPLSLINLNAKNQLPISRKVHCPADPLGAIKRFHTGALELLQKLSHLCILELRVIAASLQLRSAGTLLLLEWYAGVRATLGYGDGGCGFGDIKGGEGLGVLELWRGQGRVAFEFYGR